MATEDRDPITEYKRGEERRGGDKGEEGRGGERKREEERREER